MSIDNITSLATGASTVEPSKFIDAFSSAVIAGPANSKGISGFEFDIPSGENVTLTSDITDHWTENNSFVNDHIVNKPIRITLKGFVGELTFKPATGLSGVLRTVATRLSQLSGFLGNYSPGFVQKLGSIVTQTDRALASIDEKISTAENVVSFLTSPSFGPPSHTTKQSKAFVKLESLWSNKTIVTVQTPWRYYPSMVIETVSFDQDEQFSERSDISVTLKEFRSVELKSTSFNGALFSQPNAVQSSADSDNGPIKGLESGNTAAKDFLNTLTGKAVGAP